MKPLTTLVVLLNETGKAACFQKRETLWENVPVDGEASVTLALCNELHGLFDKLNAYFNRSSRLAEFIVHVIYARPTISSLKKLPEILDRLRCEQWQALRWEPLQQRAAALSSAPPLTDEKLEKWLVTCFLPLIDTLFNAEAECLSQERALHAQAMKTMETEQKAEEETLENLKAKKQALQNEIAFLRSQRANSEQVVTFMPAVYRNFFGTVKPSDLTLLLGELKIPKIPSTFPEPDANTVAALQRKLRHLPEEQIQQIRGFCLQLFHKLEIRAEMRDWLGVDEP